MSKEHDKLIKKVETAQKAFEDAKAELKAFLKENPLTVKTYSLHELRMIREKTAKTSEEDHKKSNESTAKQVQREALINEAKSAS
ncbi:MAG: hypothetical protein ACPGUE_14745 [Marinomonas sp.]